MDISGIVNSCGTCGLEADLGWRLIGQDGLKSEFHNNLHNLPDWGTVQFTRGMPALNHDTEGVFELEFGIINSIGTPFGDMNSFNDLQSVTVIFDDTIDLQITSMYPKNAPTSADYFYGDNSVAVDRHKPRKPFCRTTTRQVFSNGFGRTS